jgi:TetR/AcrR family transcriptional repressor of nem operon
MKVSREQARANRDAVVKAASHLFRAHGVDGVSIGDAMRAGGLTHGGFYNQFASKEALAAEACARALNGGVERWRGIAEEARSGTATAAIADHYLSARNRDAPETGCALVALGPDAARRGGDLATAFREGMEALVEVYAEAGALDRDVALADVAQMVGALVIARAVHDEALSDEILAAARKALGA